MSEKLYTTSFPDEEYIRSLSEHELKSFIRYTEPAESLIVGSAAKMNWIGGIVSDPKVAWQYNHSFLIDELVLTRTNPEWDKIIIDQAGGNPIKLRELLTKNPDLKNYFDECEEHTAPILTRLKEGKSHLLDGMSRTIAAIIANKTTIPAYTATLPKILKPCIHAGTIYNVLWPLNQGHEDMLSEARAALRLFLKCYSNTEVILRVRFSRARLPSDTIQNLIEEVLAEK